jgi:hypothetical protein
LHQEQQLRLHLVQDLRVDQLLVRVDGQRGPDIGSECTACLELSEKLVVLNLFQVFNAYCDPAATISFATPTAVTAYITDIPEFEYLAPCAQSAISYAIG